MENKLKKRFLDKFYDLFEAEEDLITEKNEKDYISLKNEIRNSIDRRVSTATAIVQPLRRDMWFRYSAVAAVVAMMFGTALFFNSSNDHADELAKADQTIKPGGNNAILTLANGQQIILNNTQNGQIASQAGVTVVKTAEGLLTYVVDVVAGAGVETAAPLKNTITTPKGGEYSVVLPDGSEVHLNAASSLTYPAFFAKHDRSVELTGEAYFSVAKDAARPFKVSTGSHEVEVLGTRFNLNAYDNEASIKTTLEEGSVRINDEGRTEQLSPGQQMVSGKGDNKVFLKRNVNVDKYIAWKNGFFTFEKDDLKSVMRQIARWYDVDVTYDGEVSARFSGELFKSSKLSTVLKILEINGLNFQVKGKNIIVSQIN